MSSALWTDEFLTQQRQLADPLGDAVIREVFDRGDIGALNDFMGASRAR